MARHVAVRSIVECGVALAVPEVNAWIDRTSGRGRQGRSVAPRARPAAPVGDQGPRWGRRPPRPRRADRPGTRLRAHRAGRGAGQARRRRPGVPRGPGTLAEAGRRDRAERGTVDQSDAAGPGALHRRPVRRSRRRVDDPGAARAGGTATGGRVRSSRARARRRPDPGLPAVGRLVVARPADAPCPVEAGPPPVLAAVDELVVDLRSGSYAALAP